MTTLPRKQDLLATLIVALLGWLSQGCGRSPLLVPGSHKSPNTDAGSSTGTDTGEAVSQPITNRSCPAGLTACGRGTATRCYDLTRSQDHCGECTNACAPGITCQSSKCQQYACKGALTFQALPMVGTGQPQPGVAIVQDDHTIAAVISFYRPVLGDFDRDGILDFVGVAGADASMGLLLGKGDGTFKPHTLATSLLGGWAAAAADLNDDGWLDLATTVYRANTVTVRLGNGDPATRFEAATEYPRSFAPTQGTALNNLLFADLDDDGYLDLVVSEINAMGPGKSYLYLWPGSTSGKFGKPSSIPVGSAGDFLVATDWNRDGTLDLLFGEPTLRMVLGRGDGTFGDETACGLNLGVYRYAGSALADFDHDRKPDLAIRENGVFLGMNGCNFTTTVSIFDRPRAEEPGALGVADLNGDGNADIVTVEPLDHSGRPKTSVHLGNGHGGFAAPLQFSDAPWSGGVYLIGDLNQDTKLDIIVTQSDGWQVLLNTCR